MGQPAQHQQQQPGFQEEMYPKPQGFMEDYQAAGKLEGKVAIISGGDSGIGRAVAIGYAKEGSNVAIIYLNEDEDATITKEHVEKAGGEILLCKGDIADASFCQQVVDQVIERFGKLDVLVNNAAEQHTEEEFEDIPEEQIRRTFDTNIFGAMFLTQAALPHIKESEGCIINTASIVAYQGHGELMDYATTKGAILGFTRSLASNLADKHVRVNAVAPGPIWTPLIPASFSADKVESFGESTPMGRAGQPDEVAPAYIFLASHDASYITGQTIHPNGGTIIGG